jgi:subtilisin family serine protease
MSSARPRVVRLVLAAAAWLFAGPSLAASPDPVAQGGDASSRMLIVAIAAKADPAAAAASTPRGYAALPNYAGSTRSIAGAARLARDYDLHEVSAWTIRPLRLRCMLYQIAPTADRDELIERLRRDARVQLAQPLQNFDTLGATASAAPPTAYNDPYIGLQRGFAAIGADQAQRWSNGADVRVAVIDAAVDAGHPDLRGRIAAQRDFVADARLPAANDRHGTEVAGVIGAVANNRLGIAGVAPGARLYAYRACWSARAGDAARCNSFTLALALGAAIDAGAQIINLSLGGPADPLLEQLARHAVEHGAILVGAVPPSRRLDGFPLNVPGVVAVAGVDDPPAEGPALRAPGSEVLTLEPGGGYDYASGSSLAAAHVSGAIALLLQLDAHLTATDAVALLGGPAAAAIDVCAAAATLRRVPDACRPAALAANGPSIPLRAR